MGASVFVAKRGGMIITCAATSGFMIEYDNRYLWMNLKTLKGCHFANYREAWEANRLVCEGKIHPTLSKVFTLDDAGEAAYQVHHNLHEGKLGVLVPRARGGTRRDRHRERCASACVRRRSRSSGVDVEAARRRHADRSYDRVMTAPGVLTEIDHVAIAVHDLDAAIAYYRDTFGCDVEPPRGRRVATASRRRC